jgi:hypothetical protein
MLIAAIIGSFGIIGEYASRELAHLDVVFDTIAADAFA